MYVNDKYRNKLKVIFSHLNTLISKLVDSSISALTDETINNKKIKYEIDLVKELKIKENLAILPIAQEETNQKYLSIGDGLKYIFYCIQDEQEDRVEIHLLVEPISINQPLMIMILYKIILFFRMKID